MIPGKREPILALRSERVALLQRHLNLVALTSEIRRQGVFPCPQKLLRLVP